MNSFNEKLRMLRKKIRYTQLEVAEKLEISDKSLSDYERGRAEPDIKTLIKIANFFNVSLDYLLGNKNKNEKLSFRSPYQNTQEFKKVIHIIDNVDFDKLNVILGVLKAVVGNEVKEENII